MFSTVSYFINNYPDHHIIATNLVYFSFIYIGCFCNFGWQSGGSSYVLQSCLTSQKKRLQKARKRGSVFKLLVLLIPCRLRKHEEIALKLKFKGLSLLSGYIYLAPFEERGMLQNVESHSLWVQVIEMKYFVRSESAYRACQVLSTKY
jgi:hypothetical protein